MGASIANHALITPDKLDVIGRPRMARMTTTDNEPHGTLSPVVKDAAKRAYGKHEAAAAHLGKDKGNFSRDVDRGDIRLKDLEALGGEFLGNLGEELVKRYGPMTDPKAEARRAIRAIEEAVDILKQRIEVA